MIVSRNCNLPVVAQVLWSSSKLSARTRLASCMAMLGGQLLDSLLIRPDDVLSSVLAALVEALRRPQG